MDPDGRKENDLVYFSPKPGSDWPYHVGFDTGNDQIIMLQGGEVKTVDKQTYLNYSGYGIAGYVNVSKYIKTKDFKKNVQNKKSELENSFDDWDNDGTVCIDVINAGFGDKYKDLKKDIKSDYKKNSKTYKHSKIGDKYFWRKNTTYAQFYKNKKMFRSKE
jgi:hypothetical protein